MDSLFHVGRGEQDPGLNARRSSHDDAPRSAAWTRLFSFVFVALGATVVVSCGGSQPEATPGPVDPSRLIGTVPLPETPAEPVWRRELDPRGAAWVEETLASLTLEELAGQLVIQWIPGGYASATSEEFLEIADWVETWGMGGGVSISIGLPHTYVAKLNELQSRAKIPLLVTADFENGGPGMRINHSYAIPSLLPQGGAVPASPPRWRSVRSGTRPGPTSTAASQRWKRGRLACR